MSHLDSSGVQPHSAPAIVPSDLAIEEKVDRLDELVSMYFDEMLEDHELTELEGLILQDDANLTRYVDHARLHADLHQMFNPLTSETTAKLVASLAESGLDEG